MSEVEPDFKASVAATSTKAAAKLEVHFITASPPRPIRQPPPPWPPMKVDGGTPRQQWDFVRKVYATVLLQYCLAGSVVAVTCFVPAVPRFFTSGPHVAAAYFALVVIVVAPFVGAPPLTFLALKFRSSPVALSSLLFFSCPVNLGVLMLIVQRYGR